MLFFYIKALMYITVTYKEMENEKLYFVAIIFLRIRVPSVNYLSSSERGMC